MILIVEDEPIPRMLASDVLSEAGLDVIQAASADEAISLLEEHDGAIKHLFTDVRMPGRLNGIDLARAVCERWPDIHIVITSGHITPDEATPHCVRFIPKPWTTVDLLNVVL